MLQLLATAGLAFQARPAARGRPTVRHTRTSPCVMAGKVVVTDGTDSFYSSRTIFQMLHDFGDFTSITASSSSAADAKKMLLSRQARYSGLTDVLEISEADFSEAITGADTWVSINSDAAAAKGQIAAAKAAGVKRVFMHFSSEGPTDGTSAPELQSDLDGMVYTVMRTGKLVAGGSGGGLKLSEVTEPTCEDVCKEDVFRILTEAITLDSAHGRMFSLCPTVDAAQFKEMRMAGCDRREEADALLKGVIKEKEPEVADTPEEAAAMAEKAALSDAEEAAAREEELKMLVARARKRGEETAERLAKEEEEKVKLRQERQTYFNQNLPKEDKDDDDDKPPPADEPPPPPPEPKKGDDDDDGLALA